MRRQATVCPYDTMSSACGHARSSTDRSTDYRRRWSRTLKVVMSRFGGQGWVLLRDRNFGPLWAGQLVSQIGDSLNRVALLWFVYHLTGSTLKTSLIGLLQTIPPLLLSPVIGVFLDRLPKK